MYNHEKNKKHSVTALFVLILPIVLAVVLAEVAFGDQKADLKNTATIKLSNKKGMAEPFKGDVDMVEVYKNQVATCQQDTQQLQDEFDAIEKQYLTLKQQNADLQKQNSELQKQLKEATSVGGSAVKAYCESPAVSRNTAGATNNCEPYICESVSGLCNTRCKSAADCSEGYVCDTDNSWLCVK